MVHYSSNEPTKSHLPIALRPEGLSMFDGREPIYRQIADQIRQDVVEGALQAEEQVMSTTQYATNFRINPATAAKAFAELIAEGVLYQRRGLGTFVATGARGKLLADRRKRYFTEVLQPALEEAVRLGIPLEEVSRYAQEALSPAPTARATEPANQPAADGGKEA